MHTNFLPYVIYSCLTIALVGCGGGGGSSGMTRMTAPATTAMIDTTPRALLTPDATDFATEKARFESASEYDVRYRRGTEFAAFLPTPGDADAPLSDNHLSRINAAAAYARGATGAGETIAIMDSGLLQAHQEFDRAGKTTSSLFPDAPIRPPRPSHGTAVSAVAVGNRDGTGIHGVAFDANLRFITHPGLSAGSPHYQPLDISEAALIDKEIRDIAEILAHPINLAPIINYSFGYNGAISLYDHTELMRLKPIAAALAQTGKDHADKNIVVWAAGNAGGRRLEGGTAAIFDSPEISPGLGVAFPELRSHVLAVVALDQDGTIAGYSNHCGIAKSFCLAAPGSRIVTAGVVTESSYVAFSGTSFAAPIVSGALAVLRQFFRNDDGTYQLGNTELVTRLLETANKTGIYADSDIYGQGLVDLDAATRPVGVVMTGLASDPASSPLAESRISVSGNAFGALQQSLAGVTVTGFDALGAPFAQANTALINTPSHSSGIARHKTFDAPLATSPYRNHDEWRLSLTLYNDDPTADLKLASKNWWVSFGHHGGQSLGLYHQPSSRFIAQGFNDPIAFTAPYLSLVRSGPGLGWINKMGASGNLGLSLMHGTAKFDQQYSLDSEKGTGILLDYQFADSGISLQTGAVYEPEGFLGAQLQGGFGDANAATWFVGVNSSWAFGEKRNWQLLGSAYLGNTRPQIEKTGLLQDADAMLSSSFSLGVAGTSIWQQNDWFGVRIWQPLRVEQGEAKLRMPVGRTKYGQVLHQDHEISLAPTGRNLKMETSYRLPVNYGELQTSVGVEKNPQHDIRHTIKPFLQLTFERRF